MFFLDSGLPAGIDESARRLHDYWYGLPRDQGQGGGLAPHRREFDPVEVPYALSGIQMVEVVLEPERLIYRLVGTREVEARGFDPTGKDVRDGMFGNDYEPIRDRYCSVARRLVPLLGMGSVSVRGWRVMDVTLFLPLVTDDANRRIVVAYSYQTMDGKDDFAFMEPYPLGKPP